MYDKMKAVMEPFKAELEAAQKKLVPGRKKSERAAGAGGRSGQRDEPSLTRQTGGGRE